MINEILDNIQQRFTDAFDFVTDPIWRWYFWLAVVVVVGGVITWFFGWLKVVRITVGLAVATAAIFVAGGYEMHNAMKGQLEDQRRKLADERAREKQKTGGGWFGN